MVYTLTEKNVEKLSSSLEKKQTFSLSKFGTLTTQTIAINNHISMLKNQITTKRDLQILGEFTNEDFYITINLSGFVNIANKTNELNLKEKQTTILYSKYENPTMKLAKNTNFQNLGILVKKEYIKKIFPKLKMTNSFTALRNISTNIRVKNIATELYKNSSDSHLWKVYKESKVLEILYLELNSLLKADDCKVKFSAYDKKALGNCIDIMKSNSSLINPPSISELSKQTHLNEFKLKYGLRKFYNTSAHKVLHDERMRRAKTFLQNKEMNINEISKILGYKYTQSFSLAFKKHFGESPKCFQKKYLNVF